MRAESVGDSFKRSVCASYGSAYDMDYTPVAASLLALVLYYNTLSAEFAYDDSRAIQKNQDLLSETPLVNLFYDDFWGTPLTHSGSHKSYRPLCVLTFRLNHYLDGLNPWGYHLGNVLLHMLVTWVFTHLARVTLRWTFPTLVAGAMFASHPIHTEAVSGIVGRADVGACLFFLLAFLCYVKYVTLRDSSGGSPLRFIFALGTFMFTTASMLCKEHGVTVLAVCITYEFFIYNKIKILELMQLQTLRKYRRSAEGIFFILITGAVLIAFRIYFMGNKPPEFAPSDNPASDSDSMLTRSLTYFYLPVLNFWLLLCPATLSFDWSMAAVPLLESTTDPRNIITLGFYAVLLYLCYYILIYIHELRQDAIKPHMNGNGCAQGTTLENKTWTPKSQHKTQSPGHGGITNNNGAYHINQSIDIMILSFAIIIFPFIPATNLFFYVGFVIAERVLYIPSMGFCLLVAHGACVLERKHPQWRQALYGALGLLVVLYSCRTIIRNQDWQTEEKLYKAGIGVNPPKAWGNLANILNGQGKHKEAEQAYRNALQHRGNMADTHYNLAILLQDQKRYTEAIESYKNAIQCRPKLSVAHLNLALLYSSHGSKEEAEKIFLHCANLDTSGLKDPRLHENAKISALYNLGRMYADMNRYQDAINTFKEALKRRPNYYAPQSIYNLMGEAYFKLNNLDEAEHWYREALTAKPDHVPAHLTMAKLFHQKNQLEEAESWYLAVQDMQSDDSSVDHHYAQFLAETGRHKEASVAYSKAVSKKPNDFELVFNAANSYRQAGDNEEAEQLYLTAVKLRPDEATAHMNLGAMLHYNGKLEDAEQSYLTALRLKPDDETTKTNLVKLRNILKREQR